MGRWVTRDPLEHLLRVDGRLLFFAKRVRPSDGERSVLKELAGNFYAYVDNMPQQGVSERVSGEHE
jgi:hypothetical protein